MMELIISIIAIVISLFALFNERTSMHDQAYDKFSQLWFGLDQIFIDYPYMRKFFYYDNAKEYAVIDSDNEDYDLALCIAERFSDVFQYTEPWEKYLKKEDRDSYTAYKQMIQGSPAMKELRFRSWYFDEKKDKGK